MLVPPQLLRPTSSGDCNDDNNGEDRNPELVLRVHELLRLLASGDHCELPPRVNGDDG